MQDEFDSFFSMISPKKKMLVQKYLFMTIMRKNRIISRFVENKGPDNDSDEDGGFCMKIKSCFSCSCLTGKTEESSHKYANFEEREGNEMQ